MNVYVVKLKSQVACEDGAVSNIVIAVAKTAASACRAVERNLPDNNVCGVEELKIDGVVAKVFVSKPAPARKKKEAADEESEVGGA